MKKTISFALAMLLLAALLGGCKQNGTTGAQDGSGKDVSSQPTPGYSDSVWFDELFVAYYPAQLEGKTEVIFSKAYFYGEAQTKQPVMCLCSKPINEVFLFEITDGVKGEILYGVEKLRPMEVIWIFPELAEQKNPDIGVSFLDEDGNSYSYTLSRNEAGNEVVVEPFEG